VKIEALTSLRFFAAMLVVLFHYGLAHPNFPVPLPSFGYEAVTFFFVLSGFVLVCSFRNSSRTALNFYRMRIVRIWPAYILGLILALPFYLRTGVPTASGTIAVIFMLQAWWPPWALLWNIPAWSLSNEAFFYAAFPLLLAIIIRCRSKSLVITGAYILVLVSGAVRDSVASQHDFAAYFPLFNFPEFIFGMALGHAYVSSSISLQGRWRTIFTGCLFIVAVLICLVSFSSLFSRPEVLTAVFGMLIYSAAKSGPLGPLSFGPLVLLGEASYGIYIFHWPLWFYWIHIRTAFRLNDLPQSIDLALYLMIVIAFSIVSLVALERPFQNHQSRTRRSMPSAHLSPNRRGEVGTGVATCCRAGKRHTKRI